MSNDEPALLNSDVPSAKDAYAQSKSFVFPDKDGEAKDPLEPKIVPNPLLKDIPAKAIRQAWFTTAHLILSKGMSVLDIRCKEGMITYTMAALNPEVKFIGIDPDKKRIKIAKEKYKLPNLDFMSGDFQENFIPKNSIDAIVNSFTLYRTYSESRSSAQAVIDSLERQYDLLKNEGHIFIQSHTLKSPDEFVLMELVDEPKGFGDPNSIEHMSDINLLIDYSERAGVREKDAHCGFYLEELPARFPKTRLFRLPAKWAYEFILKKNKRDKWEKNVHIEHSFFTREDFRRTMKNFGMRILYSAPYWNEQLIKKRFNKALRLFNEDGTRMETPETSFILVAQKVKDKQSLLLQERKPNHKNIPALNLITMRNKIDGKMIEVVSRNVSISELLPYRISNGRLHIFVHQNVPRALTNSIPRSGNSLDGKEWSGHMTEAISIPQEILEEFDIENFRSVIKLSTEYLGLKPKTGSLFEKGPGFYPAPDCVDEHIASYYLQVAKPKGAIDPKIVLEDLGGFSTHGKIVEIDAQQILNAIGVGFLPSSRLEIQILALYEKLGIDYQSWSECPLGLTIEEPEKVTKLQEIITKLDEHDNRLEPIKASAGQLKSITSIFVDEGKDKGGITGLASRSIDFVTSEENTMNTALILPLTKSLSGEVMAGIIEQYLPAPQRYSGNGYMLSCPSLPLPKEITNFEEAKKYIADKFEVPTDNVVRMGESYFSHIGITPQRIYPFAVNKSGVSGWRKVGRAHGVTSFTPLYNLYRLMYLDNYDSFMKVVAMSYQCSLGQDSDLSASITFSEKHADRKDSFISMEQVYDASYTPNSSTSTGIENEENKPSLHHKLDNDKS